MEVFKKLLLLTISVIVYDSACAQLTKISIIDVYGNRKISSDVILSHLKWKEGDSINPTVFKPDTIISALKSLPGIKHVTVNPVCCDTGNTYMLYIGIAESDSAILKYRPAPTKNVQLSNPVISSYRNFLQQVKASILKGESSEEYFEGYSLLSYPAAQREQSSFIVFANQKLQELEDVLKYSKHAEQRAAAAQIIAYSANKNKVAELLLYAIMDEDENVRNNAARAISVLAAYLSKNSEVKTTIPAAPFVDMLNSVSWADRNKGAMVLAELTQSRDKNLLEQIKKQAMPSVFEMAKWKNRGHAFFSYLILCRIAGEDESSLIEGNFSNNWAMLVEHLIKKVQINK